MNDPFSPSIQSLIRRAKTAETPAEFWSCQDLIRKRLLTLECLVRKRRTQLDHLKQQKFEYTKRRDKKIPRIHRFDEAISHAAQSEAQLRYFVDATRYIADTLVFLSLPLHEVKVWTYNEESGFIYGKEGSDHECEIAAKLAEHGLRAFVHDLSHCMRIGDLLVLGSGVYEVFECKSPGAPDTDLDSTRIARQLERLTEIRAALARQDLPFPVLFEEFAQESRGDLPTGFLEIDHNRDYLVDEFTSVCRMGQRTYNIMEPESGLYYVAARPDADTSSLVTSLAARLKAPCAVAVGFLEHRIEGLHPYVPPITVHDIPVEVLCRVISGEILFRVFVDLSWVDSMLSEIDVCVRDGLTTEEGGSPLMIEFPESNVYLKIGHSWIMHVLYGIESLASAVQGMKLARHKLQEEFPDERGRDDERGA